MSPDGVHQYEMPTLPDDEWPADDPALASLAEDLRIIAAGPAPEPRPGLVAVMRQGPVPLEPSTTGRKRKMLVKTLLGGLASKIAMGTGLALASVTAAGAAGVLPDAAQHAVAQVVEATTPFQLPDPSQATTLVTGNPLLDGVSTTTSSTLAGTKDTEADDDNTMGATDGTTDTTRAVNHGLCVSTAAKDKTADDGSHGKTVSSIARSDCGKTDVSTSSSTSSTTSTTLGTQTTAGDQRSSDEGPDSPNSGKGNGGNSGNAGKGSSGK